MKYKKNLQIEANKVISYGVEVAELNNTTKKIHCLGMWTATTAKHLNHVASELGFTVVKMVLDGEEV